MATQTGTQAAETLTGTDAADTLSASLGNDLLNGGAGNDVLYAGGDDDTVNGDAGNDTLYGEAGKDVLNGGAGNDTLYGGDDDDTLVGSSGSDVMDGGAGADVFQVSGALPTTLIGGDGDDTVVASGALSGVLMTGVEKLKVNGSVTISNSQATSLSWISGLSGSTYTLTLSDAGTYDLTDKVENLASLVGSSGIDIITVSQDGASGFGHTISAGAGNDTVTGGEGNDVINGDAGNDALYGGVGDDVMNGGAGTDTLTGGSGADTLLDSYNGDTLLGGAGDDTLKLSATSAGTAGVLDGGDGTDILDATGVLNATLSNIEELQVRNALTITDVAQLSAVSSISRAESSTAASGIIFSTATTFDFTTKTVSNLSYVTGSSGNDVLTLGDDGYNTAYGWGFTLSGGDGDDTLICAAGFDTINGGSGNDTITMGDGSDVASGGAGNDRFQMISGTYGNDTITDFDIYNDVIDVSALGYTSISQIKALMSDVSGSARLESDNGTLIFSGVTTSALTAGNFIFSSGGAPRLTAALSSQTIEKLSSFSFTIPTGTFVNSSGSGTITYTAKLSNGNALPSWLTFDASTLTFSGTSTSASSASYTVRVVGTSTNGMTGTADFVLTNQTDPGSTTSAAYALGTLSTSSRTDAKTVSSTVGSSDSVDMIKVVVSASSSYNFSLYGLTADANLTLLNSSGTTLASSSNSGTTLDSITQTLAAGTYYLKVVPASGVSSASYTLRANTVLSDAGGSSTTASIALGTLSTSGTAVTRSDWVGLGDTADYYKFVIVAGSSLSVSLSGLTGNADLALINSSGTVVSSSSNSSTTAESLSVSSLAAGTYYLRVTANTGTPTTADSTYSLQVASTVLDTAGSSTSTAKSLGTLSSSSLTASDWVSGSDVDMYKVVISSSGRYTFSLSGLTGNADLYMYDSTGSTRLASSLNSSTTSESITLTLAAGTYYLKSVPSSSSAYTITAARATDAGGNSLSAGTALGTLKTAGTSVTKTDWVGSSVDSSDYYKVVLLTSSNLSASLGSLTGNADLALLNSSGTVLKSSSNSGTTSDSLSVSSLAAGTYYLRVTAASGVTSAGYTLTTQAPAVDQAGSTTTTAKSLGTIGTTSVSTSDWVSSTDSDLYKVTISASTRYTFALSGLSVNANLYLYSSNGTTLVASSTNSGTTAESITTTLAAGTYYLKALTSGSSEGAYTISAVRNSDTVGNRTSSSASLGTLSLSGTAVTKSEWVGATDTSDYYQFTVSSASNLSVSLSSLTGNADVSVLNSSGTVLKTSANSGTTSESLSVSSLAAGTYYLRVSSGSNVTSAGYSLTVQAPAVDQAGSTVATAKSLGALSSTAKTVSDFIGSGDQTDTFQFSLSKSSSVSLSLSGLASSSSVTVQLLNSSTQTIKTATLSSSSLTSQTFSGLASGTYYMKLINSSSTDTTYLASLKSAS